MDRGRGRRSGPGRAGRRAPGRPSPGVPGARGRPHRRPGGPVLPDPRTVHGERLRRPIRTRGVRRRAGPQAAVGERSRDRWRVHAGGVGQCSADGVRSAAGPSGATPKSCACCAGARSRHCGARSSRSRPGTLAAFLPALATGRLIVARRRGGRRGTRAAPGRGPAGLGLGAPGAAVPGRRLHAVLPRRTVHIRRRGLGRQWFDPGRRRLDRVRLGGVGPAPAARAGRRPRAHTAARRGARRAGRWPGAVLPAARRATPARRGARGGGAGRPVGPRLGRAGVQRHTGSGSWPCSPGPVRTDPGRPRRDLATACPVGGRRPACRRAGSPGPP